MIETLRLVRGAVAEKDLVPVLTHFHIYDGRIQGGNGHVAIDAPLEQLDMDITVPADKFLKAVDACNGDPRITLKSPTLIVSKGSFRVRLPLAEHGSFPRHKAERVPTHHMKADLLPILRRLRPFVGTDASRKWMCSIKFEGEWAYATTNPILARIPWSGEIDMVLPVFAIDELLRINLEPVSVVVDSSYIMFIYENHMWLRTSLIDQPWPDINRFFRKTKMPTVPKGLADAIERILPFCPNPDFKEVHLGKQGVSTADGDMSALVAFDLPEGRWHADVLLLALSEATHIKLENWPDACPWKGSNIQGIAMGLRG